MTDKEYTPEGHLKVDHEYKSASFDNFTGSVIDRNGVIVYYKDGEIHRDDGDKPAIINTKDYKYVVKRGWIKNGKPHRLNGLAYEDDDPTWQRYAYNGKQFPKEERDEWIKACGHTKVSSLTDKLCDKSFTGPVINSDDEVLFLKEGEIHREDGPAMLYKSVIAYVKNGSYHRLDGPAIIKPNGVEEYWIEDKPFSSKEEWEAARDRYVRIEKILKHYGLDKVVKVQDVVEVKEVNSTPTYNFTGVTISNTDTVVFWKDGEHHRDNGDFSFYNDFNSTYPQRTKRVNGNLHSTTGPAWVEDFDKSELDQYYLDNRSLSKEEWEKAVQALKEKENITNTAMQTTHETTPEGHRKVKRFNNFEGIRTFTGSVIDEDGLVCYYKDGKEHREDGPSFINTKNNRLWIKEFWCQNGKAHRLDGPARVERDDSKYENSYYIEGEFYKKTDWENKLKEMGLEVPDGKVKKTYKDAKVGEITPEGHLKVKHWTDKGGLPPSYTGSVIDKKGYVRYYKNGVEHREDGPAFINTENRQEYIKECWVKNGLIHREDGPAWKETDVTERYALNGTFFEEKEDWEKELKKLGLGKFKPSNTKPQEQQIKTIASVVSTEAQEAAYRIARNELVKIVRGMLATQIGGTKNKETANTFLSSELGASLVFGAVGILLPKLEDKLPARFQPHLERLNKEFRVSAMASLGNNAAELLRDSLFVDKTTKILQQVSLSTPTQETTLVKEMVVTVSVSQKS